MTSHDDSSRHSLSSSSRGSYLNGRWRPLFSGGCGGQGGGRLDESGGHLWRYGGGGACRTPARGHVAHQPHAAVHLDVGVALGGHVENLEPIVIKARELTLVGSLPVIAADRDSGLSVEDGQLPAWCRREGGG